MSLENANQALTRVGAKLQALAKHILLASKPQDKAPPDRFGKLEEATRLSNEINWEECRSLLKTQLEEARQQRTAELHGRREALLNASRTSGLPTDSGSTTDRVDIFRLNYEGATVAISFGGVPVAKIKETDGRKVLDHLRQLRESMQRSPFARDAFCKNIKAAYVAARRASTGSDEFVAIRELHRELLFERARRSAKFAKDPDPKHIEPYPLFQFLFDLARFGQEGWKLGQEIIKTQAPSMREHKEAIFLLDLARPLGNETAVAGLAIKQIPSGEVTHGPEPP